MNRAGFCVIILAMITTLFVTPVVAQDDAEAYFVPRFSSDVRLRYQHTTQEAFENDAEALTLRFKGAVEFDVLPKTVLLAEVEGSASLIEDFNDGVNGNVLYPFIPDPEGISLNRLQITTEAIPKTRATLGRQRIAIDDWRFIGNFPFRQNDQTFDALRIETKIFGSGILDTGYFNRVLRPLGDDNIFGEFNGDSWYANYNTATPLGRVSAFHYALDIETGPENIRLNQSSQTTGIRVLGRRHWNDFAIVWEGSYAVQRDYAERAEDFNVDYALAQISIEPSSLKLKARAEILGDDNGISLQTPIASLHKFQGLADQFLQTPPDGLRDYSLKAEYLWGAIGRFENVRTYARHHWFQANSDGRDYGRELDVSFSADFNEISFSIEYADYEADSFSSNTRTLLFTTQYRY